MDEGVPSVETSEAPNLEDTTSYEITPIAASCARHTMFSYPIDPTDIIIHYTYFARYTTDTSLITSRFYTSKTYHNKNYVLWIFTILIYAFNATINYIKEIVEEEVTYLFCIKLLLRSWMRYLKRLYKDRIKNHFGNSYQRGQPDGGSKGLTSS
jgi:hypothetical protein